MRISAIKRGRDMWQERRIAYVLSILKEVMDEYTADIGLDKYRWLVKGKRTN